MSFSRGSGVGVGSGDPIVGGDVGVGGGSAVEQARERIIAVIRREPEISLNRLKSLLYLWLREH